MKAWSFTQNPILHATDGSYQLGMQLSTFHDSALNAAKTDPFILPLYNSYHPLHLAYKSAYEAWVAQGGLQQGETLNLSQLLLLLSNTKIKAWDIAIQNVYAQNTTQYTKLLPNRRTPFQTGSQQNKINAVNGLSIAIGGNTALATVKMDVDAFYKQLDLALTTQKGSKSNTATMSGNLETARVNFCIGQYSNIGAFIQKYAATPEKINQFFDLQGIRNGHQTLFTGLVATQAAYTIVKHTFGATDQLNLLNSGTTQLKFYLSQTKDANPPAAVVTLEPSTQQTIDASALGNIANSFLMVYNADANMKGEFSVEIL